MAQFSLQLVPSVSRGCVVHPEVPQNVVVSTRSSQMRYACLVLFPGGVDTDGLSLYIRTSVHQR